MGDQERYVEQQFIASEAAVELDKLAECLNGIEQVALFMYISKNRDTLMAAVTMMREVILKYYGLTDDPIIDIDMDDFVEFIVGEGNR